MGYDPTGLEAVAVVASKTGVVKLKAESPFTRPL
jgi:hypothetical protein